MQLTQVFEIKVIMFCDPQKKNIDEGLGITQPTVFEGLANKCFLYIKFHGNAVRKTFSRPARGTACPIGKDKRHLTYQGL